MTTAKLFKSVDLKSGPLLLTIASIAPSKSTGKVQAATVSFRETSKCITLTRRRVSLFVELFGENIKAAVGKQIELFRARGMYKGVITPFVHVRSVAR